MPNFKKCDRVKLSQKALKEGFYKKSPDRLGTVVGESEQYPDCPIIHWDGKVKTYRIRMHESYLELVEAKHA